MVQLYDVSAASYTRWQSNAAELITEKNPPVNSPETKTPTTTSLEETPVSARTRLIQVVPNTSVFAGWGPRLNMSTNDIMRGRN